LLISLSYRDLEELMAEPLPRAAAVLSQSAARTDRSAFSVPNNPQRSGLGTQLAASNSHRPALD
jgi:hypothetical protein